MPKKPNHTADVRLDVPVNKTVKEKLEERANEIALPERRLAAMAIERGLDLVVETFREATRAAA